MSSSFHDTKCLGRTRYSHELGVTEMIPTHGGRHITNARPGDFCQAEPYRQQSQAFGLEREGHCWRRGSVGLESPGSAPNLFPIAKPYRRTEMKNSFGNPSSLFHILLSRHSIIPLLNASTSCVHTFPSDRERQSAYLILLC